MKVYHDMIDEVLAYGTRKENRTGVDTLSTWNFNYELGWDPWCRNSHLLLSEYGPLPDGEYAVPLLTTKRISWKNIVAEMLWFLSGRADIGILERHGCKFWSPWVDEDRNVPSAYGNFWRQFPVHKRTEETEEHPSGWLMGLNDQIAWVLDQLRTNPSSRRMVVSAWAPGNAQTSKLPPCHLLFVFNVQNVRTDDGGLEPRLCLHLTQRSCDLALGVPYNMASYGLLLLIFSHLTGIKPGIFAHTLCDLHIYTSKPDGSMAEHDHEPGLLEQRVRTPKLLPRLVIDPSIKELSDIEALMGEDVSTEQILEAFKLHNYDPHPAIKFKVAV